MARQFGAPGPQLRFRPRLPPNMRFGASGYGGYLQQAGGPPRFDPTKHFTTPSAQQDIDDTLERAVERILQKPLPPLRPHVPTAPHDRTDEIMKDFITHDHDREMSESLRKAADRIMSKPLPELPEHKTVLPPERTPLLDKINQEFRDILQRQNRPAPSPITPPGGFDPYQRGTTFDNRPMVPHPFGPPGSPPGGTPNPLQDMWRQGQPGRR